MTNPTEMLLSNRLDLDRFFFAVRDQVYVIVKLSDEFPNYYKGSDIDVFCYDENEFAKRILSVGNWYIEQGFEVKTFCKHSKTCLDFYYDGDLDFRFELYQSLPRYKKICLKEHYIYSVIENASTIDREFEDVQYPLYVPAPADNLLLRYVEYIEWYEQRPDKIKHLEYILAAIDADAQRIGFIDKLHLYTKLPEPELETKSLKRFYVFRWLTFWINRIRAKPLRQMSGILFRKVRQFFGKKTKSSK